MLLSKIEIRNFKGLQSVDFAPSSFGCLVGENNAGKSSVLQAIVHSLSRQGQLPETLFYDPALPVVFTMAFTGVSQAHLLRLAEEHRAKITELVTDSCLTIVVRYPFGQKCETFVRRLVPIEARYRSEAIAEALTGKRSPHVFATVEQDYPEFVDGLDRGANIGTAKAHLAAKIAGLPRDRFTTVEAALPTGLGTSITNLLPEPIYIPAVKNLHDDLKTAQSTSFGRLLGLLLDEMRPDLGQVTQSLAELNRMLNRTDEGDNRHARVQNLERRIEGFLQDNFPTIRLELTVPPPELRTILNSAQILIDDGSRDLIDNKGDGIKRSLTFALLQTYVAYREEAGRGAENEDNQPAPRPLIF